MRESASCTDLDVLHIRCSLLAADSSDFFVLFFVLVFLDALCTAIFAKRTMMQSDPTVHTPHLPLFLLGIHIKQLFRKAFDYVSMSIVQKHLNITCVCAF